MVSHTVRLLNGIFSQHRELSLSIVFGCVKLERNKDEDDCLLVVYSSRRGFAHFKLKMGRFA